MYLTLGLAVAIVRDLNRSTADTNGIRLPDNARDILCNAGRRMPPGYDDAAKTSD